MYSLERWEKKQGRKKKENLQEMLQVTEKQSTH